MKVTIELKGCGTRVVYDCGRGEFAQVVEAHLLASRQPVPEERQAAVVTSDRGTADHVARDVDAGRRPPARPFVALAWMRTPDARACLPVGPCLPMPAKRQFEARYGHHVRVRCRLPDTDGQPSKTIIIE